MSKLINISVEIDVKTIGDFINGFVKEEKIEYGEHFFDRKFKQRLVSYLIENKKEVFELSQDSEKEVIALMDEFYKGKIWGCNFATQILRKVTRVSPSDFKNRGDRNSQN